MKLILRQIIESQSALNALGKARGMSSTTSYKILKNIKVINEELKSYNDTRTKVLEENSKKNEEGKAIIEKEQYQLLEGKFDIVNKSIDELIKEQIDINIIEISLNDIDSAGLSAIELESLEFMINFEEL